MLTPFTCGIFHPEEDDDQLYGTSPCSTPRRSLRRNSHHNKESKNPYSARGLDKFEALLSDLQEKRQQIYTQKGSSDISLVRFAYTSSNDCVPIVVKKDKANKSRDHRTMTNDPRTAGDRAARNSDAQGKKSPIESSSDVKEVSETKADDSDKKVKNKSFEWGFMRIKNWRRPSYYMPVAIVLILLFLAFFGRSVAILCTSIGWYIVPALKARSSNSSQKPATKKKELGRRLSDNKMVINNNRSFSPPNNRGGNNSGPDKSPDRHGHRKSW